MPTILTAGKAKKQATPFWAQQPITCKACSCEFQLDLEENAEVFLERAEAGGTPQSAHVYCPHCGNRCTVLNPDFTPPKQTDAEKLAEEQAAHATTLKAVEDVLAAHKAEMAQAQEALKQERLAHEATADLAQNAILKTKAANEREAEARNEIGRLKKDAGA